MKINLQRQCLLTAIICIVLDATCSAIATPFAVTPVGRIDGYYKLSYQGRRYAAYEGIPYVLPPIGELRFQPPSPITKYPRIINATKLPNRCIQYDPFSRSIAGTEDCLYLNIYSPQTNSKQLLPVIFWIHGGGFQYGTSSAYGAKFLMDRDVILVTFNYRVGPFGFLSTGDHVVPGNMGLKDQSMALRWIHDNVRHFNGDNNKITLMGVSAGGASVHHHYLSPMSAGLFQNGISFSGTALARWAYSEDTLETTKILASALNCSTDDSQLMVKCLRKIEAGDIAKTVKNLLSDLYFSYVMFPPVLEKNSQNYFINDSPLNIIRNGQSNDVPWIAGVVSEEGLYITAGFALNDTMIKYTNENWEIIAPYMLHYKTAMPKNKHDQLAKFAKKHYFGDRSFSTERSAVKKLTHLAGDDQIVTGAVRAAKLQAQMHQSPVWFYYYSYRAAQSLSDHLANTTENLGVSHDDDIYMVLQNKYIDPTTTYSDRAMLQYMLNFWYSVAVDGKPNLKTKWSNLNASKKFEYMHIAGPGNFTMQTNDNLGEVIFWESIGL